MQDFSPRAGVTLLVALAASVFCLVVLGSSDLHPQGEPRTASAETMRAVVFACGGTVTAWVAYAARKRGHRTAARLGLVVAVALCAAAALSLA
jgi:hypothetical protein